MDRSKLLDNLERVLERMACAARRAGRDPAEVELMAVVKKAPPDALRLILESGRVRHAGENRVQEAVVHPRPPGSPVEWHMVGHLQTNKVKPALRLFDWIDSVDSLKLARALQEALERPMKILVQVKLSELPEHHGAAPEQVGGLLEDLAKLDRLEVSGLMGLAPWTDPVEEVRPYFRKLKTIFDRHFPKPGGDRPQRTASGAQLSMGMSRDFEVAIEEGATLVRVGTALFEGVQQERP